MYILHIYIYIQIHRGYHESRRGGEPYLWKTETQLNSPLAHFAWYSGNFGFTDWRKGPMKGILNLGPSMDPLSQMYFTEKGESQRLF